MKHTSIKQALQHVADNPAISTDELIALPVHELVCRALFDIANNVDVTKPRSLVHANRARQIIFSRMVGRRRTGSHPAVRKERQSIEFRDLTGGRHEH